MGLDLNVDFIKQWEQEFLPPLEGVGDRLNPVLCADCFTDEGLRLEAEHLGITADMECPNCHSSKGPKLSATRLKHLLYRYFTSGSVVRREFGGFPTYISNGHCPNDLVPPSWLGEDLKLLADRTGWGVIPYGPRAWMYGEVNPLKLMLEPETQVPVFERISNEYPTVMLSNADKFYRMRLNVARPDLEANYDSPPVGICGKGRLDSSDLPVLYGSRDMEVCVHECRTTAEDEIYVATLAPSSSLHLLEDGARGFCGN